MNDDVKNSKKLFLDGMSITKIMMSRLCLGMKKKLDHDVEDEINSRSLNSGTFLDLGTGPGTQAIQLSEYGFKSQLISQTVPLKKQKNFQTM